MEKREETEKNRWKNADKGGTGNGQNDVFLLALHFLRTSNLIWSTDVVIVE